MKDLHRRLEALALDPCRRDSVLGWLEQQPELPAVAPLPRLRSRVKRHVNTWRGRPPTNHVATHPWGYLVEMVCGSQGPVAEHLLASWLEHSFRDFELARFSALPGPAPQAEPWLASSATATIQVRGGDLNSWPTHALVQRCPVENRTTIRAVACGSAEASPVLLNLAALNLQEGPAAAKELLNWTQFERVWDTDPERVRILRQFGVNASWLNPSNETPQTTPQAEPWQAQHPVVHIQVRGGDLNSWPTHALVQRCPVENRTTIRAVACGSADASPVLLNLAALECTPASTFQAELQLWSECERVWDPDPERVALLRQLGIQASWLNPSNETPQTTPQAEPWQAQHPVVHIQVRGGDLNSWPTHALVQHCPIHGHSSITAVPCGSADASPVLLNLAALECTPASTFQAELQLWSECERVWDPDPERVALLRQLGIQASWLHPQTSTNGYLTPSAATWALCSQQLGLATPSELAQLGSSLCLGSNSPQLDGQLEPPLLGIPGFANLSIKTREQAHLQALWLQGCLQAGLELVVFQRAPSAADQQSWGDLVQPNQPGRAPILLLDADDPNGPRELLDELAWYRQGCPAPIPCSTPSPNSQVVAEHRHNATCTLAVCISLYNYGPRIHQALASVAAQEGIHGLELIVVDDASTDNGAAVVESWMAQHHQRFARCLLLQHNSNGGLASARNTAFAAAESPWCFVLDADNQLSPLALAHCGKLAEGSDPRCAVVHSLIRVQPEPGCHDPRQLVSDRPWQQELFKPGNYIDAMALVRRSAWQAVGGYTHIPGGWEDFDFWCCLIDAGWHGVLWPQV
ncbi:MAG: glycosyltransferase family 2 protein, partial [Cyanobacteria bacterium M_surface_9_m1_291]|nr:glycosyltransferase family 2 protein [Cyanobacteria bacterium M_surface_9_m1_291]